MCGVISGIITVVFLKLLENKEHGVGQRGVREGDEKTPEKIPQEHDERRC